MRETYAGRMAIASAGMRPSAKHINGLDGFRGIAFLLVFLRHYTLSSHAGSRVVLAAMAVGQGGWIGVDLFFTLSGFLITGILWDTRDRAGYFRKFFARRALRIFPLYYGVFLLLALLTPVLHLEWHWGHLGYLLYAGNVVYCVNPSLSLIAPAVQIMHLWSLAVEEQFYLVWPVVVRYIGTLRRLAVLCLSLSAVALVLRAVVLETVRIDRAYEWCYAMLPTHMDGLLYGALGAVWVRSWPVERIQPIARRISVAAAGVMAAVYAAVGFNFYSRTMILVGFPVLAVLFASILLQTLQAGSWASRVGNLRALRFFGKYSYGMYVFHILFSPLLARYQAVLQGRLHSIVLGGLMYIALTFVGTCVAAVLSYQLYEKHWLRLKSRFAYGAVSQGSAVAS